MKYSKRAGVINEFEINRAKQFADYYNIRLDIVDFDLTGIECIGLLGKYYTNFEITTYL